MADNRTLPEWLAWMEAQHPSAIELGLDRVRKVAQSLGLSHFPESRVILVGGTNGKGSTCAFLEALARSQGLTVGVYSSPHIARYNERVRVNGRDIDDADLVSSFEVVEAARGDVALTFFEFGTLAALVHFQRVKPELLVLEIGLGGRLDAVNVVEPDVSVVTTVALDHQEWLGHTVEAIAGEKAGIYRAGKPAIFGDMPVPESLRGHAERIGARLSLQGRNFGFQRQGSRCELWVGDTRYADLPLPSLLLPNAATALAAFLALPGMTVSREDLSRVLSETRLAGRFQRISGPVRTIVDVAHNPQAAASLARLLDGSAGAGRTLAVVAMLSDKDIPETLAQLSDSIDAWFVAGLPGPRGGGPERVSEALAGLGIVPTVCSDVVSAIQAAWAEAREPDRVVVFGSFHTVAAAMTLRRGVSCSTPEA